MRASGGGERDLARDCENVAREYRLWPRNSKSSRAIYHSQLVGAPLAMACGRCVPLHVGQVLAEGPDGGASYGDVRGPRVISLKPWLAEAESQDDALDKVQLVYGVMNPFAEPL